MAVLLCGAVPRCALLCFAVFLQCFAVLRCAMLSRVVLGVVLHNVLLGVPCCAVLRCAPSGCDVVFWAVRCCVVPCFNVLVL